MVPATVPPNCGTTVAVKVTDCPLLDGFSDETTVVVDVAGPICWVSWGDLLTFNAASPKYIAASWTRPAGKLDVVKLAKPPLSIPVPRVFGPDMKVTVSPSGGGPSFEVTVAVSVTI
jgi:hypothetical protein